MSGWQLYLRLFSVPALTHNQSDTFQGQINPPKHVLPSGMPSDVVQFSSHRRREEEAEDPVRKKQSAVLMRKSWCQEGSEAQISLYAWPVHMEAVCGGGAGL